MVHEILCQGGVKETSQACSGKSRWVSKGFAFFWWLYKRRILGFWKQAQDSLVESCKIKQTLSVPLCQFVYVFFSAKMKKYS